MAGDQPTLFPPHCLSDVAAGRPAECEPGVVPVAVQHRMGGLLLSAWEEGRATVADDEVTDLIASDLATAARHRQLWAVLVQAVQAMAAVDVEVVAIKGVTNELRWYRRLGERPCSDVDLVLAPHCVDRVDEVIGCLAPGYPMVATAAGLIRRRQLQHVHFTVEDVTVDLHLDPLKLGIWVRHPEVWWGSRSTVTGPGDVRINVLAPELALVGALTHLNKDRFAYLGAYAEVARLASDPALDWERMARFVASEGLEVPVWASLHEVFDHLDLDLPAVLPAAGGWRRKAWERLWPKDTRLAGDEGRRRRRKRQVAIPFLARGRGREAMAEWRRCFFPPRELIAIHDDTPTAHSYLRRVTVDRLGGR